jgi:DNA polymerase-3 subunit alpha
MAKTYTAFHLHQAKGSILDGFSTASQCSSRAKDLGMPSLGISDHGSIAGHLEHLEACKDNGIKPILGCELYVPFKNASYKTAENRGNTHMVVFAKNYQGWKDLVDLHNCSNNPEYYFYKPRIHLFNETIEDKMLFGIEEYTRRGRIFGISGHQGSHLSDNLFADIFGDPVKRKEDIRRAYGQYKNADEKYHEQFLKPNWFDDTCQLAVKMAAIFGKDMFFIELQNELNPKDRLPLWVQPVIVDCLRKVSKATGIPAMASSDPHYARKEDAIDQRMLLYTQMRETEKSIKAKLNSEEDMDVMVFFGSDEFYIHSYEEMAQKFTPEELEITNKIAEQIEEYDIKSKPILPEFKLPEFDESLPYLASCKTRSDKYLKYLCVQGALDIKPWENAGVVKLGKTKKDYWDRLNEELAVILEYGLTDYFLIVWDYINAAKNRPADHSFEWQENLAKRGKIDAIPVGPGRGSGAGCVVSYLIGITKIDPIRYELSFARFFNKGRCSGGKFEYPDIDTDFAVCGRDWVIDYIRYKYGQENVAQIMTFGRMQGRAAIKDIMRAKDIEDGFEIANEMSQFIPNEAEISDEIQQMKEAGHENYGIIQWALDNSEDVQNYYKKYKEVFDQAIRCEGVIRSKGRHPSGLVVTPQKIQSAFPMCYDSKSKQLIIGVDYEETAKMGGVKLDILGTVILDKLKAGQDLVNGRKRFTKTKADVQEEN